jgi:hypothetical protein
MNPPFGDGFFIAAMMVVLLRICPGFSQVGIPVSAMK